MIRVDDHSHDRYTRHCQEAIYEIVLPTLFCWHRELRNQFNLTHGNSFLLDTTLLSPDSRSLPPVYCSSGEEAWYKAVVLQILSCSFPSINHRSWLSLLAKRCCLVTQTLGNIQDHDAWTEEQRCLQAQCYLIVQHVFPPVGHHKFRHDDRQDILRMTLLYRVNIGQDRAQKRPIGRLNDDQMGLFFCRELVLPLLPACPNLLDLLV